MIIDMLYAEKEDSMRHMKYFIEILPRANAWHLCMFDYRHSKPVLEFNLLSLDEAKNLGERFFGPLDWRTQTIYA